MPRHLSLLLHHTVQEAQMPDNTGRRIAVLATDAVEEVGKGIKKIVKKITS